MGDRVRWGILGNATIARKCVIKAIQRSQNGCVQALASRFPEKAREVAAQHDIPTLYGNYDDLLADPAITALYIPLPNHLHCPWTVRALAAGKHVLCEKPLAVTAKEAKAMAVAARKADRLLMEAFMYRFHPRSLRIKRLIDAGEIGALRLVRSAFTYAMDKDLLKRADTARLRPEMGGGALLDVGCYAVSVARWLMNAEPVSAQAMGSYHPAGVDWHLVGTLEFGPRRMAVVEASFISALQQTFSAVGSRGAVDLPHDAFIPWEKEAVFTLRGRNEERGTRHFVAGTDEYQRMVEHFSDAVLGRVPLAYTPSESIANLRSIEALSRAARLRKRVEV